MCAARHAGPRCLRKTKVVGEDAPGLAAGRSECPHRGVLQIHSAPPGAVPAYRVGRRRDPGRAREHGPWVDQPASARRLARPSWDWQGRPRLLGLPITLGPCRAGNRLRFEVTEDASPWLRPPVRYSCTPGPGARSARPSSASGGTSWSRRTGLRAANWPWPRRRAPGEARRRARSAARTGTGRSHPAAGRLAGSRAVPPARPALGRRARALPGTPAPAPPVRWLKRHRLAFPLACGGAFKAPPSLVAPSLVPRSSLLSPQSQAAPRPSGSLGPSG